MRRQGRLVSLCAFAVLRNALRFLQLVYDSAAEWRFRATNPLGDSASISSRRRSNRASTNRTSRFRRRDAELPHNATTRSPIYASANGLAISTAFNSGLL